MVLQNNISPEDRGILTRKILTLSEKIFRGVKPVIAYQWLTSNMTVAQLRILLFLYTEGPGNMRSIASSFGIAISTATGIVDKLVNKNLVVRSNDPQDRRLVICSLSLQGQKLIDRIWTLGRTQIENLLCDLSTEQLKKAAEVAGIILSKMKTNSTTYPDSHELSNR